MKLAILFLGLLSPIVAAGQTADKECEEQGKSYVTEKNKSENVADAGQSFYWSFVEAHYDSETRICYVMYHRSARGLGTVLEQIRVDDIAGKSIAGYSGTWTANADGGRRYSKPSQCEINGTSCGSMAEFTDLLQRLVPVFRKNSTPSSPRGPVNG
jgi:hypothetical protein